ncbi:MAG: acyltransferase, partial [Pseudomonadota bacterium]
LTLLRVLVPFEGFKRVIRRWLAALAESWIGVNSVVIGALARIRWDVALPEDVSPANSYVICCNHQSWVDILVLQKIFNRRAPFMRFFIKQQLIWVPFLGLAWWALDFPFMRRYSKQQLVKNPELRGRDLESARVACEKFRDMPVSMMNFMEGTRFTPAKHAKQKSPYRNLLKPRIGGLGQVLYSLNDQLRGMLDVTIVYPGGRPTFWEMATGRIPEIIVRARVVELPTDLLGVNFREDSERREALESWTAGLFAEKDALIDDLLAGRDAAEPPGRAAA